MVDPALRVIRTKAEDPDPETDPYKVSNTRKGSDIWLEDTIEHRQARTQHYDAQERHESSS